MTKKPTFPTAPNGSHFSAIDGAIFKSILDLAESLEWMSDDVFYYHVTDARNDFANWVNDVFDEKELAQKMKNVRTKERTHIILLQFTVNRLKE